MGDHGFQIIVLFEFGGVLFGICWSWSLRCHYCWLFQMLPQGPGWAMGYWNCDSWLFQRIFKFLYYELWYGPKTGMGLFDHSFRLKHTIFIVFQTDECHKTWSPRHQNPPFDPIISREVVKITYFVDVDSHTKFGIGEERLRSLSKPAVYMEKQLAGLFQNLKRTEKYVCPPILERYSRKPLPFDRRQQARNARSQAVQFVAR